MQGEYPVPMELKILRIGIAVLMTITGIVTFDNSVKFGNGITLFFSVVLLFAAVCIVVSQYKTRIIVSQTSIASVGLFSTARIALSDIKGIRTDGKRIAIVPLSGAGRSIYISSPGIFDEQQDLRDWLSANFTNITKQEYQEESEAILNNTELGRTEQERSEKLKKAKYLATSYNVGTIGILILMLSQHTNYFFPLMLAYPLLSLVLIQFNHGLIRLVASRSSPFTMVSSGITISCALLIAVANSRNHLLGYAAFWLPFLLVSLVTGFVFFLVSNSGVNNQGKVIVFSAVLIGGMYGYGSVRLVNYAYDHSKEEKYLAYVMGHYTTRGRSTSYHLDLAAWKPDAENQEITVSRGLYERTDLGSTVTVHCKQGLLHVPWFYVTLQAAAGKK